MLQEDKNLEVFAPSQLSSLIIDNNAPADGHSKIHIFYTLTDTVGTPVPGEYLRFTVQGSSSAVLDTTLAPTTAAGQYVLGVTNSQAQTVNILAEALSNPAVNNTSQLTFGSQSVALIAQTLSDNAPADGTTENRVLFTLKNPTTNERYSDVYLDIKSSNGAHPEELVEKTDENGYVELLLSNTVQGNVWIDARSPAPFMADIAHVVTFTPGSYTLTSGQVSVSADGVTQAQLPFTLTNNQTGLPVANSLIEFTLIGGNGLLVNSTGLTNANGVVYAQVASTVVNDVLVRGQLLNFSDINAIGVVHFTVALPQYVLTAVGQDYNSAINSLFLVDFTLKNATTQLAVPGQQINYEVLIGPASVFQQFPPTGTTDATGSIVGYFQSNNIAGTSLIRGYLASDPTISATFSIIFIDPSPQELPIPDVVEAENNNLSPKLQSATVVITPYDNMMTGDQVTLSWIGNISGLYEDSYIVGINSLDYPVSFSVNSANIAPNTQVIVSYTVTNLAGKIRHSAKLELSVIASSLLLIPAVDEAIDGILYLDKLSIGATIRVAPYSGMTSGDTVTFYGENSSTTFFSSSVNITANAVGYDVTKLVPKDVLTSAVDQTIIFYYTVKNTAGEVKHSVQLYLDVRLTMVGSGKMLVMGARTTFSSACTSHGNNIISVFHTDTKLPILATWFYEGDENNYINGEKFEDISPWKVLIVQNNNDRVILNSGNIFGNGYDRIYPTTAVIKNNRALSAWGNTNHGGSIPASIQTMQDIEEVAISMHAYAARRANGHVVAWGYSASYGSVVPNDIAQMDDIIRVVGGSYAFAALRASGRVVAWGQSAYGGNASSVQSFSDIVNLWGNHNAFAALRANGHVIAWGQSAYGGNAANVSSYNDILTVSNTEAAFVGLRRTGNIVAWGHNSYGANIPTTIQGMNDITKVVGSKNAFVALRSNGSVVAWGGGHGGTIPSNISAYRDVVDVVSNYYGFCILRASGEVAAWGNASYGANIPNSVKTLTDIVQVSSTNAAYAALRRNGNLAVWGYGPSGGSDSTVANQLTNVRAVYSNTGGFTALTADRRLVSWGTGSNNTAASLLTGQVSYEIPNEVADFSLFTE
ncbi:TPA: hypothetical protein ACPZHQ_002264 [Yersinia enterocolitica]